MNYKLQRTSSELIKEITLIIQGKIKNPDISPMTTITGLDLSKDLKYADVFISTFDNEEKAVEALNRSAGFVRHELSVTLKQMRTVPELRFHVDPSRAYGARIDEILKQINEKKDAKDANDK